MPALHVSVEPPRRYKHAARDFRQSGNAEELEFYSFYYRALRQGEISFNNFGDPVVQKSDPAKRATAGKESSISPSRAVCSSTLPLSPLGIAKPKAQLSRSTTSLSRPSTAKRVVSAENRTQSKLRRPASTDGARRPTERTPSPFTSTPPHKIHLSDTLQLSPMATYPAHPVAPSTPLRRYRPNAPAWLTQPKGLSPRRSAIRGCVEGLDVAVGNVLKHLDQLSALREFAPA
jgi:hypothetical protein